MKRLKTIVSFFLFSLLTVQAQDSLNCRNNKFYIEGSFGRGSAFVFPSGVPYYGGDYDTRLSNIDPSNRYGSYFASNSVSFINSGQISFGYKLVNKDCKIRKGVKHFIYFGIGLSNFNYAVYFRISDYSDINHTSTYEYKFTPSDFSIKVNKLNYSASFTMGAHYKKGFYVSNTLGLGISTFIMKKNTHIQKTYLIRG